MGKGELLFSRKFPHCGNKEFWENKFSVNSRKNSRVSSNKYSTFSWRELI
jgi:hypothetical protein